MSGILSKSDHNQSGKLARQKHGDVLQQVVLESTSVYQIVAATTQVMALNFARRSPTSIFRAKSVVWLGKSYNNANQDSVNPGIMWQTVFAGTTTNVQTATRLGSDGWYYSDVPGMYNSGTYNWDYEAKTHVAISSTFNPGLGSIGDDCSIRVRVSAGSGGVWFGRSRSDAASGGVSGIEVLEIESHS